jgi:hypothetical protein
LLLFLLELIVSVLHAVPWFEHRPDSQKIAFAGVMFIVASVLSWHHHRLDTWVKRHEALLGAHAFLVRAETVSPSVDLRSDQ